MSDGLFRPGKKEGPYDGLKAVSVRELETWIRDHIRFDVEHAAKAVPLQFETVAAEVAQAEQLPGRGKKVIPITFDHHVQEDARNGDERTYTSQSWERADGIDKSKTCDHSVLGVVVAGSEGYGKTFQVCIARDKCRVHFGDVIKQREKSAKLRESGKPKQAAARDDAAEKRRQSEQAKEAAQQSRYHQLKPALLKASLAAAQKLKGPTPAQFQRMVKSLRLPASTKPAQLAKALLIATITADFREDYFWNDKDGKKLEIWPKLLGVDVKALEPKPEKGAAA